MQRAFTLSPHVLTRASLRHLAALQPTFNQLYDAVARDVDFVSSALAAPSCAWQTRELEVFCQVAPRQSLKPRLLLPNSIFLESDSGDLLLTVGNVQAGEPFQVASPLRLCRSLPVLTAAYSGEGADMPPACRTASPRSHAPAHRAPSCGERPAAGGV